MGVVLIGELSQQLVHQLLAANLPVALVNLNLNVAVTKNLNLVMPTRNVCLDHDGLLTRPRKRVMNLCGIELLKHLVNWMCGITHGVKWLTVQRA